MIEKLKSMYRFNHRLNSGLKVNEQGKCFANFNVHENYVGMILKGRL